jgi:hypothetical protein
MRKILFYYSLGATLALIVCGLIIRHTSGEVVRLRNNQEALTSELTTYRTRLSASAASVQALQLRLDEFREARERDAAHIKSLGIKLRRVESSMKLSTSTTLDVRTRVQEVPIPKDTLGAVVTDTVRLFCWSDAWVSVEGEICRGEVACHIESVDTLHQVVHRVPRRFLGIPYGTKAIRQEIVSSNPHTKVVYAEYIELSRRGRARKGVH